MAKIEVDVIVSLRVSTRKAALTGPANVNIRCNFHFEVFFASTAHYFVFSIRQGLEEVFTDYINLKSLQAPLLHIDILFIQQRAVKRFFQITNFLTEFSILTKRVVACSI